MERDGRNGTEGERTRSKRRVGKRKRVAAWRTEWKERNGCTRQRRRTSAKDGDGRRRENQRELEHATFTKRQTSMLFSVQGRMTESGLPTLRRDLSYSLKLERSLGNAIYRFSIVPWIPAWHRPRRSADRGRQRNGSGFAVPWTGKLVPRVH